MKIKTLFALLIILFLTQASHALREPAFNLKKLSSSSKFIFIGDIIKITQIDKYYDEALIKVATALKGSKVAQFKLRYLARNDETRMRPPRTIDLNRGKAAIFFLKNIKNGQAALSHWGSFAILRAPFYFPQ